MSIARALTWDTAYGVGNAERLAEAIRELTVRIERLSTSQLRITDPRDRLTTILELHGDGHTGRGEDIAYLSDTQRELPAAFERIAPHLVGEHSVGELLSELDDWFALQLPEQPGWDDKAGYHRWPVDSAIVDLALRQAGTNLARLIDAEWAPVRTSLSMGVDGAAGIAKLRGWLDRDPTITFKLDVAQSWDAELVGELARLGDAGSAAATIDFKALYTGDWVDNDYPAALYETIARQLPGALLEDTKLTDANRTALGGDGLERLSWDYPISTVADVPGLAGSTSSFSDLRPGAINIKPSRFGSVLELLATISACDAAEIPCYSGGQFELGIGRTQVQSVTSLCFPNAPNDCAPVVYHDATPQTPDVPLGPIVPPADHVGFGWDAPIRATRIDD